MLGLLERNIASVEKRLVLLAPPQSAIPDYFRTVSIDAGQHRDMVEEVQRLRGTVYLTDGAIHPSQLSEGGLHQTPEDDRSWHLLMLNKDRRVSACAWYMEHEDIHSIDELRVRNCPLNRSEDSRRTLREAIQAEIARAKSHNLRYAEVGGWAVAKESRCTSEGLLLALAAYSLGRVFGGVLGLTTATVRHSSSTILRRLGGSHLEVNGAAVPSYYDPKYDCQMELLRFDSRSPNPKYAGLVELLRGRLANVAVVGAGSAVHASATAEGALELQPVFAA